MTLLHAILWALYPLKPVLRLKAMLASFIAVMARTLGDDETLAWLEANPWHPKGLRLIEGSIALIEDLIQALIYHRAREILGLPAWLMRDLSRPRPAVLAGSPRDLDEILLRFERALWTLRNHERFARKRAHRLARLLEQRSLELEVIHHPLAAAPSSPPPPPTTILPASVPGATGSSAQRIRAPPWLARNSETETRPSPPASPARTRSYANCPLPIADCPPRMCRHETLIAHNPPPSPGGLRTLRRFLPPGGKTHGFGAPFATRASWPGHCDKSPSVGDSRRVWRRTYGRVEGASEHAGRPGRLATPV
jgi:hypothetical protein